ncbi:Surfactin synthase thioesterase subunit [Chitinophaga eiseniae]|uniref:Surfactin synthase thioesterase subunit n=1 Tax=Chitinophaga eiseniae TaxID=634771 RepID=A0A1T4TYD2_9BACT|nr:alpha/beta fold hydrolase [Chitinophaga eiseniae]SKA45465.1 Surfactin synthase thioesterase subunit [Chitinophaga eiseniae]
MVKPQVFVLHFSGGNMYSLQHLFSCLKDHYSVELLELPGRGKRIREPLLCTREEAVADLLRQIRERRQSVPYVLYGHSMGAELGFLVNMQLEQAGDPPVCFIPTGNAGPNVHKREKLAGLDRDEFFFKLREMGGIPGDLLENEELMDFFEPILRADFKLLEDAEDIVVAYKTNTPVFAVMGNREKYAAEIENWKNYTLGAFEARVVEGDHFFIYQHADMLMQLIRANLCAPVA